MSAVAATLDAAYRPVAGTNLGNNYEVNSNWYSRPADQRFTDMNALFDFARGLATRSDARVIQTQDVRVHADPTDADKLSLILPKADSAHPEIQVDPSHWSFSQLCSLVGAPAAFLRKRSATIAGLALQETLLNDRTELVKTYHLDGDTPTLRAVTGPTYGRVLDHQVVDAVRKIVGDGVGETAWRADPVIWNGRQQGTGEPALYASDRDMFVFFVNTEAPIDLGPLPDGRRDLCFRGFMVKNSEVGKTKLEAKMLLFRAFCQNRIIWDMADVQTISIRHSSLAPQRFVQAMMPALRSFSQASETSTVRQIETAVATTVAADDKEAAEFLSARGFNAKQAKSIIETVLEEEGRPARSVWDMVQGITAVARKSPYQDERVELEETAGKLMKRAAR